MTKEEIILKIKPYIEEAKAEIKPEDEKVDFKLKWLNLNDPVGRSEFLKDLTSIANTLGGDGFIIIGIDEKGKFEKTKITDSGIGDESKIQDLVVKGVEGGVDFSCVDLLYENQNISVIHIPPSLKMPHTIRNYVTEKKSEEQRTFVRKGTRILLATKYDLEKMFLYRGKVKPEYHLEIFIPEYEITYNIHADNFYVTFKSVTIENTGSRVFVSSKFFLEFDEEILRTSLSKAFESEDYFLNGERKHFVHSPIIVEPEKVITLTDFRFHTLNSTLDYSLSKEFLSSSRKYLKAYDSLSFRIRHLNSQELKVKPVFVPYLFPSYYRSVG